MRTLRKEAMDILIDVAYLIDRLEADRQEAKEALLKEKRTRETLMKKMDSLTLWRIHEFPVVVQNGEWHVTGNWLWLPLFTAILDNQAVHR